ncbi:hypothetical protein RHMOL_Rhmol02G0106100 [Rhododendron molle]|uniref:Uncharacterized protein n=1 Tax=Rhododendron molle TaxID=49168 RepID=A0ACC0PQ25_RHOML|nr:hypothetical protein RHMOL_Rhmol02G0106100 [Rhododendron molle]
MVREEDRQNHWKKAPTRCLLMPNKGGRGWRLQGHQRVFNFSFVDVERVSALESVISKGGKVAEKDVLNLIELLLNEQLELDTIITTINVKLQRKMQANKDKDDKMRATDANVVARTTVGGDDMLSKWLSRPDRNAKEGESMWLLVLSRAGLLACPRGEKFGKVFVHPLMAQEKTTTISEAVVSGMLEWCNEDFNRCSELLQKIGQSLDHFEPSSSSSSLSPLPSPDNSSLSSLDQQLELDSASFYIPRILVYTLAPIVVPVILSKLTCIFKDSLLMLQVAFNRDTDKIQRDLDLIDTRSRAGFSIPGRKFYGERFLDTISCIYRYPESCFAAYSNVSAMWAFADWNKCYSEQRKKLSPLVRDNCGEGTRCPGPTCDKKHLIVTFIIRAWGRHELPLINSHSDLDMALDSLEPILSGLDFMEGKVWWTSRHGTKDLPYLRLLRN